jgi:tRNA (cmo5U34)-methyltransferase
MRRMPLIGLRERRHIAGRRGVPEPMVMNDPESVAQHRGGRAAGGLILISLGGFGVAYRARVRVAR